MVRSQPAYYLTVALAGWVLLGCLQARPKGLDDPLVLRWLDLLAEHPGRSLLALLLLVRSLGSSTAAP